MSEQKFPLSDSDAVHASSPPPYKPMYPQVHDPNRPPESQPLTSGHTVIVTQPAMAGMPVEYAQTTPPPSTLQMVLSILFSCGVICCCCWPLGLVAFVVALVVFCVKENMTKQTLWKVSLGFSIAGLVCGIIIITCYLIYYFALGGAEELEKEQNTGYGYN